jgi:O-antigen/teichoic acid export membrane protein
LSRARVLTGGAVVLATTMLTGAMGVLYTFAMARLLDAPQYAALVSLFSVLGLASLPAATLQTVVARFVAVAGAGTESNVEDGASSSVDADVRAARALVGGVLRRVLVLAVAVTGVAALLAPWLTAFLRLDGPTPALILAPTLGLALVTPLLRGAAQGLQAFGVLAGLLLLESLFKLAGGAGMAWAGYGAAGVLAALLAGGATCAALAWLWLTRRAATASSLISPAPADSSRTGTSPDLRPLWRFSVPALLVNGGVLAMVVLDTVLVQHYFDPADAATFAALSVTGRSLFWVSSAVTLLLLPIVARQTAAGDPAAGGRDALGWGLAIAAALVGIGELAFLLAPALVLRLLFGDSYTASAPLLPLYGAGTAALSLANVVLHYLLARGRWIAGVVTLLCALLQAGAVVLWHADLRQVVLALLAADATLLTLSLVPALLQRSAPAPPQAPAILTRTFR